MAVVIQDYALSGLWAGVAVRIMDLSRSGREEHRGS